MRRITDIREEAHKYNCEVVTGHFLRDFWRLQSENRTLREENDSLRERLNRLPLRWQMRRRYETLRCFIGLHRLRGHHWADGSASVASIDPRCRPGPGDWRVCDWCGAVWKGSYDGIEPSWRRMPKRVERVPS